VQNFVFVLTCGIEDPTRATRTLQLAKAAKLFELCENAKVFSF